MQSLQTIIDRENTVREVFGDELITTHVRRVNERDATEIFAIIKGALSPENLTWDGERSGVAIERERALLTTAKSELESLGFTEH